jgi:hypothetical protein
MKKNLVVLLVLWLVFFVLYLVFIQLLASSLGVGFKSIGLAEWVEGGGISFVIALMIFGVGKIIQFLLRKTGVKNM